jgi:hypothetical protein
MIQRGELIYKRLELDKLRSEALLRFMLRQLRGAAHQVFHTGKVDVQDRRTISDDADRLCVEVLKPLLFTIS